MALRYMNPRPVYLEEKIDMGFDCGDGKCFGPLHHSGTGLSVSAKFGKNKYTIDTWRQLEMADGRWRV